MRIAAGILMIIYGVKTIGTFVGFLSERGFDFSLDALSLIVIITAVFFTTGGVFCLKRKYWKICFASSLCLLLFMIYDLHLLFPVSFVALNIPFWVLIPLYLPPWGILPQIFVCLRKSEWQEISA
jgi:hypothetical protein